MPNSTDTSQLWLQIQRCWKKKGFDLTVKEQEDSGFLPNEQRAVCTATNMVTKEVTNLTFSSWSELWAKLSLIT